MENPPANPLQKLSATIERLDRAAAQGPARCRKLAAALSGAHREAAHTHEGLLDRLERLAEAHQMAAAQIISAGEQAAPWEGPQQEAATAAQELAAAVTPMQGSLAALGRALALGQADPAEGQAEARIAEARQAALDEQARLLAQEQALLAGAQAHLAAAVARARAAAQDAARLQNAEITAQAASLRRQALAAQQAGHPQTALALLEAAVALRPADVDLSLHLARLYLEAGKIMCAQTLCRRAEEIVPAASPALAYTQGLLALQRGDSISAVERLTQAVAGGEGIPCRLRLAEAHYRAGHPLQAVEEWRRILTLDPDEPEALAWLRQVD